jgi:hypothetical protein
METVLVNLTQGLNTIPIPLGCPPGWVEIVPPISNAAVTITLLGGPVDTGWVIAPNTARTGSIPTILPYNGQINIYLQASAPLSGVVVNFY